MPGEWLFRGLIGGMSTIVVFFLELCENGCSNRFEEKSYCVIAKAKFGWGVHLK
jgi:hypothetical protein